MTEQREELAQRFFATAHQGDLGALEALLAQNVVLHGDGGGKVPALARSLRGRSRVARYWARRGLRVGGAVVHQVQVNGQPGAFLLDGTGKLIGTMALDIAGNGHGTGRRGCEWGFAQREYGERKDPPPRPVQPAGIDRLKDH
jgi:hypothetical protein